ncbi:MAG: hypothetical protein U0R80_00495 [Nocardioidaceae bacterium]
MIRLQFIPPVGDAKWDTWVATAEAERQALLSSPPDARAIKGKLYKGGRDFLLLATHKKCAYCETFLPPGERKGDVEHYRPKGRVRDRHGTIVTVMMAGVQVQHPGYFWLAYDYHNLLPVCGACNRRARDEREGRVTGKGDFFPTLDDWYASDPHGVAQEKPALLNPWLPEDDPEEHLVFDPATGFVAGLTPRGKETEHVLGLNREGLVKERFDTCRNVENTITIAFWNRLQGGSDETYEAALAAVVDGSGEYAAFRRAQHQATMAFLKTLIK